MVTPLPDGRFKFRVYLPHAARVELVGTFTDWRERAVQLAREHPGWWEIVLAVEAGEHDFCYLVDGNVWLADYAAHGVRLSRQGSWTSRLRVEKTAPQPVAA